MLLRGGPCLQIFIFFLKKIHYIQYAFLTICCIPLPSVVCTLMQWTADEPPCTTLYFALFCWWSSWTSLAPASQMLNFLRECQKLFSQCKTMRMLFRIKLFKSHKKGFQNYNWLFITVYLISWRGRKRVSNGERTLNLCGKPFMCPQSGSGKLFFAHL